MAGTDLRYGGPANWNITGPAGGPFTNSQLDAKLGNRGNHSLSWAATSVPSFVRLSAMNGSIGGHVRVPISGNLDPSATTLAAGNYSGNIVFHNQTTSEADVLVPCVLTVQAATVSSQLNPLTDFSSQGPASGPFQPDSQVYTLTNSGTGTLSWQVHSSDAWLSPAPTSGQLAPGASIGVNLSINDPATAALSNGMHQAVVEWRNAADNSVLHSRNVNLNVMVGSSAGWTVFTPSPDTRTIYISSSTGNDANDGLSQNTPKRTIAGARSLLRNGYPDWLLLKKGDTWDESFGNWGASGRSATEPLLISSYGTDPARPLLRTGNGSGLEAGFWPGPIHNVSIVGIHFLCNAYDGVMWTRGVECLNGGANLLIEDCVCEGYNNGIVISGGGGGPRQVNVAIRRSIVIDCWTTSGTGGNGIYCSENDGLLMEENVVDNNGWIAGHVHSGFPGHNIYVQNGGTGVVFRGNIVATTDGIQLRPGGVIEENLFLHNAIALEFGGGVEPDLQGVTGRITHNVLLDGGDYDPTMVRGWGMRVSNVAQSTIDSNVVAHNVSGHGPFPLTFEMANGWSGNTRGVLNTTFSNNVVYNWNGFSRFSGNASQTANFVMTNNRFQNEITMEPLLVHDQASSAQGVSSVNNVFHDLIGNTMWMQSGGTHLSLNQWKALVHDTTSIGQQQSFPDPNRTIMTYNQTLGGAGTLQAFVNEARQQSKSYWRPQYTAVAVNNYIRAGFGL